MLTHLLRIVECIEVLEHSLAIYQTQPNAWSLLGMAYEIAGNKQKAMAALSRVRNGTRLEGENSN